MAQAPKIRKTKISQKINLKNEFGVDLRGKDSLKQALGQAIIDKMVTRTEAGEGMRFGSAGIGQKVKLKSPYSKPYTESLDFKAAGKRKHKVNMTLTGDMLGSIDVLSIKGNTIEIGIDDDLESKKGFNHITGDTVPRRPFFGVNGRELKEIKREFKSDIKQAVKIEKDEGKDAFDKFVLGIIKDLGGEVEDGS